MASERAIAKIVFWLFLWILGGCILGAIALDRKKEDYAASFKAGMIISGLVTGLMWSASKLWF